MTTSQQRLVIGNWKMHGSLATNRQLLAQILHGLADKQMHSDIVVCVPQPYLYQMQDYLSQTPIQWGAQNMNAQPQGAFTGEVSAAMLQDFACGWVLVGHSERRALYGESDADVVAKTQAALAAGITPVICVGETEAEQAAGQTEAVIARQLEAILRLDTALLSQTVIAYEPVWAIGTGKSATPEQAQAVHAYIRSLLKQHQAEQVRILYGGSVNATNAAALFAMPDIDGALVGGASLKADEFLSIAAA